MRVYICVVVCMYKVHIHDTCRYTCITYVFIYMHCAHMHVYIYVHVSTQRAHRIAVKGHARGAARKLPAREMSLSNDERVFHRILARREFDPS